jgi:hypothetical protein
VGGDRVRETIRHELDSVVRATAETDEPLPLAIHSVTAPIVAVLAS